MKPPLMPSYKGLLLLLFPLLSRLIDGTEINSSPPYLLSPIIPGQVRQNATSVARSGIIDQVDSLGYCHIAGLFPVSLKLPSGRTAFRDTPPGMAMTMLLALDMLNKGDGSVIPEVEGLPERCPLRFTGEVLDSALSQIHTMDQVMDLLDRTTTANVSSTDSYDNVEVCAFLGAPRSAVTIPMAVVTGVRGRPQVGLTSTSTALDNKQQFPYFGRLYPSDAGVALPFLLYLKEKNVRHLGVVHWNDDYGNTYARALVQIATEVYPELAIVSIDVPRAGARSEFEQAIETLEKTSFRWFFRISEISSVACLIRTFLSRCNCTLVR